MTDPPIPPAPPQPETRSLPELLKENANLRLHIIQLEKLLEKAEARVTKKRDKPRVTVTKNPIPVTRVTKKGRPSSGNALTPAEKQRAYRERKKSPRNSQ